MLRSLSYSKLFHSGSHFKFWHSLFSPAMSLSEGSEQRNNKNHSSSLSFLPWKKKKSCAMCIKFILLAVRVELFINPQSMICFSFMVLSTQKKILALLLPAPQESHLDYNHTTHGIKPLVKKWSLLHLDLETLKTTLSYSPKIIKRSIFVCFSGIFTSSCERINVAGLHFICSLFFKIALPITIALPMVIKSEEKSQSLSKWTFLPLCTKGKIFHN